MFNYFFAAATEQTNQTSSKGNWWQVAAIALIATGVLLMFAARVSGSFQSPEQISTARFREEKPVPIWGFVSAGVGGICFLAGVTCGAFAAMSENKRRRDQRLVEAQARLKAFNSGHVQ